MISFLRRFVVESWIGRILAGVIFLAFVGWGVGDVLTNMADDPAVVATIGSQKISTRDFAAALQAEMPRLAQQMGAPDVAHIPPALRQQMGNEILQRLVSQSQVLEAAHEYGISVPDSLVRNEIFAMPYFQGKNGAFDRQRFNAALANAGMSEERLITLVRNDLAARAVMEPLSTGAHVPDVLVNRTYGYETATRVVDVARVPFASVAFPSAPDEATLKRFYTNHPWLFRSPEYRHARIVVLSPETVAAQTPASEDELHHLYDAQKERFNQPELRSVQLVTSSDQASAEAVATLWKGGAEWNQIQASAKGSAAVEFNDARASLLPSATLQKLVFTAAPTSIQGPSKTDTGWVVFRVTKVSPPHATSFEDAKPTLQDEITKGRGPAIVSTNEPKLRDAIAGGGLDSIPTNLGAAAAAGFLDGKGMTKDGEAAPLPASGDLRTAIIDRIFAQDKGAPPQLAEAKGAPVAQGQPAPSLGWYAVSVDEITPSQPQSFEAAHDRVLLAWQLDARRHVANVAATALYVNAGKNGGVSSVAPAGTDLRKGLMVSRARPVDDLPRDLMTVLLRMPAGRTVMDGDDKGFLVATVTAVQHPDPKSDSLGMGRVRDGLTDSLSNDMTSAFIQSLGARYKAKIIPAGVHAAMGEAGFGDGS
ncbi:peptidylprolyl isomerase [Acetobacter conturbans]|uniref:Peptidylprolyl isomerase n=1 Tax=Acetobacter conturbans TaxID=1737472 RepID=A0ABX0K0R1_9PROT|nr:peptidylprolyl isomerase [Acetobacter conturbans]NHN89326.1 peptidylprolyl isomerase [Acetobacter conturbans]